MQKEEKIKMQKEEKIKIKINKEDKKKLDNNKVEIKNIEYYSEDLIKYINSDKKSEELIEYINQLSDIQKKILLIGFETLESSFNIRETIGFIEYYSNKK